MQFPGQGKPPLGVIFDCDLGNRIDDALALALLYGLDGKNECRVVSVSVSRHSLNSAALAEVIGRFYAGAVSGAFGSIGRTLPVGMSIEGPAVADTPMLTVPLSRQTAEGKPEYNHGIHQLNDTAETPALIRNAFTSQQDQNCIVILAGPATNLAKVLSLPDSKDWIKRKVRYLVVSGGSFPDGAPEFSIKADIPSAKKLFAEWPTPIFVAGQEIGAQLPFPAESIEKDFAWSTAHPVVDAYRAYRTMPYDAPTFDMAAVLYAVRPQQNFFATSDPGSISVTDDGRTVFTKSAAGTHRYLILEPAQKERVLTTYREIASAKPVERPRFRFPTKKADEKKAAEKKAEEKKTEEKKP